MRGWTSLTTIVTDAVSVPPELVAVTVYTAEEVTVVGVPEIAPVVLDRVRPAGSEGDTDQEVTAPPVEVGETVVIAVPLVSAGMDE
jgi:hypothetical protein